MSTFFNAFNKVSKEEWKNQIISDLKGKDHSILEFNDLIEELEFKAYYHNSESTRNLETPGNYPFTRGLNLPDNNWSNGALIQVMNEKKANKEALQKLMSGADFLYFKCDRTDCDWATTLSGIKFEFIKAQFDVTSASDYSVIRAIIGDAHLNNVSFNYDLLSEESERSLLIKLSEKTKGHPLFLVNGFAVQQLGATTWQEISFCLNVGHEYLLQLMNTGLNIDEAATLIHFHIGVGSNYLYEIAKLRTLRQLWAKLIDAYQPKNNSTYSCTVTAVIGHMNKSLKDPYTNLLRQTTEAMSATNGANNILVLPYNLYSNNGSIQLAERMAVNISLILKEESYLDRVIDPTGGSYSIEQLTHLIGKKAWETFQQLESSGGLFTDAALNEFRATISKKRQERIDAFVSGKTIGIGINKYADPNETDDTWKEVPSYLGIKSLIFELELQNISA